MKSDASAISRAIREMAGQALGSLPHSDPAYAIAGERVRRPIDYMRCAEFSAIYNYLTIVPGMSVLDVGSPQWFSMCLARVYPAARFDYMNIIDTELEPFRKISQTCGLTNLRYHRQDARELSFEAGSFDRVISISVIEHIYPEIGGDVKAMREIKRVMKPGGEFLLTVPYKEKRNIVYVDGPVYERESGGKTFFAREYDGGTFDDLIAAAGFKVSDSHYITEKPGLLALDYYNWGPGKTSPMARYSVKLKAALERILRRSLDESLARRYLRVTRERDYRVVNIAARLIN